MKQTFSAARLRALREHNQLSRDRVAQGIGRTVSSVTRYEQGIMLPSVGTLADLAELFGVGVEDLFDRSARS